MEMWDYRIEPYLSYAGGKVIDNTLLFQAIKIVFVEDVDRNLSLLSYVFSVNTLPPKYAPKQEEEEKADEQTKIAHGV